MSYHICTAFSLPGAHHLNQPYATKCSNIHGHTYKFEIHIGRKKLLHDMVIDFSHLKNDVLAKFIEEHDHIDWNTKLSNPTSEVMAEYTYYQIKKLMQENLPIASLQGLALLSVTVWESESNGATYFEDGASR